MIKIGTTHNLIYLLTFVILNGVTKEDSIIMKNYFWCQFSFNIINVFR